MIIRNPLSVYRSSDKERVTDGGQQIARRQAVQDYRQLHIWLEAMTYVEKVYGFSSTIAKDERYGLVDQLKRAAISIPLNISEGAGCKSRLEV
jgi:hypothetical protein